MTKDEGARRGLTWAWGAVLWLACQGCAAAALKSPADGGRPWYEARSKHFVVQTDAGADDADALLAGYEQVVSFFENVAFRAGRQPQGLTRIVSFKDEEDYRVFAPRLTAAYFMSDGGAPYDPSPTIVMTGGTPDETTVAYSRHELTHRFVAFHFPAAPPWLQEGLAEYYETLQIEGDTARLGLPPVSQGLSVATKQTMSRGWTANTASGPRYLRDLPPAELVRKMSWGEFYASDISQRDETSTAKQLNYIAAWAQVHVLMLGPEGLQARFVNYLNALARGSGDAWKESFDAEAERSLEAEYRSMMMSLTTRTTELPAPRAAAGAQQRRALDAWEVHWLWAALRDWDEEPQRRWASVDIEHTIRLAPERPDGYLLRAALALREQRQSERRRDLELALARGPSDPNALAAMAWLLLPELGARPPRERRFTELDPLMKKLRPRAQNAPQWLAVARYDALQGRMEQATRCAKLAARSKSSCFSCYWTIADLELEQGHVDQAARYLQVAAGLAGERVPAELLEQLRRLQAELQASNAPAVELPATAP